MIESVALPSHIGPGIYLDMAIGLAIGLSLGLAYFLLLQRSAKDLAADGNVAAALGFMTVRLALAAGIFWFVAKLGALPLLSCLAGFLVARLIIQKRILLRQAGSGGRT